MIFLRTFIDKEDCTLFTTGESRVALDSRCYDTKPIQYKENTREPCQNPPVHKGDSNLPIGINFKKSNSKSNSKSQILNSNSKSQIPKVKF